MESRATEVADLLSCLIRNRCVSEGFPSSGEEERNVRDLLAALDGHGLDIDVAEPVPARPSLIARIEGSDPNAPSLCLLGHTDVVPADPTGWEFDPFGGQIIDDEVRGRGAVDMLNQTAAMALAVRNLADEGFRPRGDIVFWAVPDEECGGHHGARRILQEFPDLVRFDNAITEVGGARIALADEALIEAYPAEKGAGTLAITVRGAAGHTSLPFGHRNAVVVAAEVIRRIDEWVPRVRISAPWRSWVEERYSAGPLRDALLDATTIDDTIATLPPDQAAHSHASTRCTATATIIQGGDKVNSFPETVRIAVNVRPTWRDDPSVIVEELQLLLSDLVPASDVVPLSVTAATRSPLDNPLWQILCDVTRDLTGARLVPSTLAAQTDARWLRPADIVTYGFGLLSPAVTREDYWSRFHGVDERIDIDSLGFLRNGYEEVIRRFCG